MKNNPKIVYAKIQILGTQIDELTYGFKKSKQSIAPQIGQLAKVPLKNKTRIGIINSVFHDKPNFKIR